MSIKKKEDVVTTILTSTDAPASVVIDTTNKESFSIQLNYSTGTSSSAKLQASNDGSNYVDVPNSTQTLGNSGGSHVWNVTGYESAYCKVVVSGDALANVVNLSAQG